MSNYDPIIATNDDGLIIPEVGLWSKQKWGLLGAYCNIFTSGMRHHWNQLVYIDLFSGAGFAKIKDTDQIFYSSTLIALSNPVKFDKYIFCERDPELMHALKQRVGNLFPEANVSYILGDANTSIGEIKDELPEYSIGNTRLPFCFVDPFSLDLSFEAIEELCDYGGDLMDYLILLALHMDANRNLGPYLNDNNNKIELFTGSKDWRSEFSDYEQTNKGFIRYLSNKYDKNMVNMGYVEPENKHLVRSSDRNLPLYYLAFYSKHKRGNDFYRKIKHSANKQFELGL